MLENPVKLWAKDVVHQYSSCLACRRPRVQSPVPRTERQKKGRREGRMGRRERERRDLPTLLEMEWVKVSLLVDLIFEVLGIEPKI